MRMLGRLSTCLLVVGGRELARGARRSFLHRTYKDIQKTGMVKVIYSVCYAPCSVYGTLYELMWVVYRFFFQDTIKIQQKKLIFVRKK